MSRPRPLAILGLLGALAALGFAATAGAADRPIAIVIHGGAGVIVVMDFNTPGMFRALRDSRAHREIGMYDEMQ